MNTFSSRIFQSRLVLQKTATPSLPGRSQVTPSFFNVGLVHYNDEFVHSTWLTTTSRKAEFPGSLSSPLQSPCGSALMQATIRSFQAPFVDSNKNVETFLEHIRLCRLHWHNYRFRSGLKPLYSPYFAVIQSSMMGKTRLFFEVPNHSEEFLMYVCLRKKGDSGYPPSVDSIQQSLVNPVNTSLFYASFLFASISQLQDFLKEGNKSNTDWLQLQTVSHGSELWNRVTDKCRTVHDSWVQRADINVNEQFHSLLTSPELKNVRILFVFDEARNLMGIPFQELRRSFMYFPHLENAPMSVLTDTFSKISNLAPPSGADPSSRAFLNTQLFPPFYLLANVDVHVDEAPQTLDKMADFNFYLKYGRPSWGAMLRMIQDRELNIDELHHLAQGKLIGGLEIPTKSSQEALAILGVRLCIDVVPQCHVAQDLVAQNMRSLYFVSDDREMVITGYFSEPVLVNAAAHLTYSPQAHQWPWLLKSVLSAVRNGVVTAGVRGELVARILLLLAWDRCCLRGFYPRDEQIAIGSFLEAYQLTEFLSYLVNLDSAQTKLLQDRFSKRGAALITKHNQPGVDLIIPVVFSKDKGTQVDQRNVSYVLVQVKNHARLTGYPESATVKLTPDFSGLVLGTAFPFLSLYLSVGPHSGPDQCFVHIPKVNAVQTRGQVRDPQGNRQICLAAFSLDSNAFKVLDGQDELKNLLDQLRTTELDPLSLLQDQEDKTKLIGMRPCEYVKT